MNILELGTKRYQQLNNFNIKFSERFNLVVSPSISNLQSLKNLVFSTVFGKFSENKNIKNLHQLESKTPPSLKESSTAYIKCKINIKPTSYEQSHLLEFERNLENHECQSFDCINGKDNTNTYLPKSRDSIFQKVPLNPIASSLNNTFFFINEKLPITLKEEKTLLSIFPLLSSQDGDENSLPVAIKKLSNFRTSNYSPATNNNLFYDKKLQDLCKKELELQTKIKTIETKLDQHQQSESFTSTIAEHNKKLDYYEAHIALTGLKKILNQHNDLQIELDNLEEKIQKANDTLHSIGDFNSIKTDSILQDFEEYLNILKTDTPPSTEIFSSETKNYYDLLETFGKTDTLALKHQILETNISEKTSLETQMKSLTLLKTLCLSISFLVFPLLGYYLFNKKQKYHQKKILYLSEQIKLLTLQIEDIEDIQVIKDDIFSKLHISSIQEFKTKIKEYEEHSYSKNDNLNDQQTDRFNKAQKIIIKYLNAANLYYDEVMLSDHNMVKSFRDLLKKYLSLKEDKNEWTLKLSDTKQIQKNLLGKSSIQEIISLIKKLELDLKKNQSTELSVNSNYFKQMHKETLERVSSLTKQKLDNDNHGNNLLKEIKNCKLHKLSIQSEKKELQEKVDFEKKQKQCMDVAIDLLVKMKELSNSYSLPIHLVDIINLKVQDYTNDKFDRLSLSSGLLEVHNKERDSHHRIIDVPKVFQGLILMALQITLFESFLKNDNKIPIMINLPTILDINLYDKPLLDLLNLSLNSQIIIFAENISITRILQKIWKNNSINDSQIKNHTYNNFSLYHLENC